MKTMEENMRRRLLFLMIAIMFCFVACKTEEENVLSLEEIEPEEVQEETEVQECIYVYVCGAVQSEGVYQLECGSRVYEAIAMAGGFREDAATTIVNQAELLQDGERLYVPRIGEDVTEQTEDDGKVNLNSATKEELMTLPGVGASRAESIIQYRKENGGFKAIEDIMQVSGIKEGMFERIKDLITI